MNEFNALGESPKNPNNPTSVCRIWIDGSVVRFAIPRVVPESVALAHRLAAQTILELNANPGWIGAAYPIINLERAAVTLTIPANGAMTTEQVHDALIVAVMEVAVTGGPHRTVQWPTHRIELR